MDVSPRQARIVDASDPTRPIVHALIYHDVTPARLQATELVWSAERKRHARHAMIEHSHWDWRNKIDSVEARQHCVVEIHFNSQCQGFMAVLNPTLPAKQSNGNLLYIDYLEIAPWNLRGLQSSPKFLGVGSAMIREAVFMSHERGSGGRIGLHSLPQAEEFYEKRCKMTRLGSDPDYYDLPYFEYTDEQAREFVERGGEKLP